MKGVRSSFDYHLREQNYWFGTPSKVFVPRGKLSEYILLCNLGVIGIWAGCGIRLSDRISSERYWGPVALSVARTESQKEIGRKSFQALYTHFACLVPLAYVYIQAPLMWLLLLSPYHILPIRIPAWKYVLLYCAGDPFPSFSFCFCTSFFCSYPGRLSTERPTNRDPHLLHASQFDVNEPQWPIPRRTPRLTSPVRAAERKRGEAAVRVAGVIPV